VFHHVHDEFEVAAAPPVSSREEGPNPRPAAEGKASQSHQREGKRERADNARNPNSMAAGGSSSSGAP
jgi:hypothetical protein